MPIRLKEELPVIEKLRQENIFAMGENRASHQDIRQLKIAILNLMPDKENTELQLLRLISNSPLQIEVTFLRLVTHKYKNTSALYLLKNYHPLYKVDNQYFDGLIITGAPVEQKKFEDVDYWGEITSIMEWSKFHVTSVLYLSWAAQAGLYYHYGIPKYDFKEKLSGIYKNKVLKPNHDIVKGFDKYFFAPQSRYTGIKTDDINKIPELEIIADSNEAGAYIISDGSNFFVTGHPEYDTETLEYEYLRDKEKGLNPKIPANYFLNDDPDKEVESNWISYSNLLFSNWLNYFVYQVTPYNL